MQIIDEPSVPNRGPSFSCTNVFLCFSHSKCSVREQQLTSSPNNSVTNYGWLVEAFALNHRNNFSANICFFHVTKPSDLSGSHFLDCGKIQKQVEHTTATLPLIHSKNHQCLEDLQTLTDWQFQIDRGGGERGRHVFFKKTNRNQPGGITSFLKRFSAAYL